jgi:predicted glycosyltransferase
MKERGHEILFTTRDKEYEIYLLKTYGFKYISFGKHYKSKTGKAFGLLKFTFLVIKRSLKFKPDLFLSHGSIYNAIASYFLRKPNISLEDTGNFEQVKLYLPFTEVVLTSTYFQRNYGSKQLRYPGFHELAYLHPKYFTPDTTIKSVLGVDENSKIVIIRFVAWSATHDSNIKGLSEQNKLEIVKSLNKYAKVFISSESGLPDSLEQFRLKTSPDLIHQVLANADLLIGESGTMTSECAVLGTPAIQISGLPKGTMGVLAKQEDYGLVHVFEKFDKNVLNLAISLLSEKDKKMKHLELRNNMLKENIDLTAFLVDFVSDRINQKLPLQIGSLNFNNYYYEQ